jgi:hypothetical protein
MYSSSSKSGKTRLIALSATTAAVLAFSVSALADISQSGEQKNMKRVGHVDLQGRASYQSNVIVYPDGRTIAFAGTQNGSAPNFLKPGSPVEQNGTMIIDVTNPAHPVEKAHIPVPVAGGQAQTTRMCLGSDLPGGTSGHVYLLRDIQGSAAQRSGYEIWDVTDVSNPAPIAALTGIRNTHKDWWECKSGIAYMPGSKNSPPLWRQSQSMVVYDWGNPPAPVPPGSPTPVYAGYPKYIRTYGLVGAQPDGTGAVAPPLDGPISTYEHPQVGQPLARGAGPDDVIGNRIYLAWGGGDDGALQIVDRKKLLPPSYGGTWVGDPDRPTTDDLESAQTGLLYMSADQGGHTSMPVFGMTPASYANFTAFKTRDIVLLTSEATSNRCQEAPHWAFVIDITIENSRTAPPGTRVEQSPWQGPMVLSTMSIDPRLGEQYPRGNYCTRGARFGAHSSEENFNSPLYGKLTVLSYFTGGVRVWDIREPQSPVEVAFYVPVSNANTAATGYMTNNVEVDNRGFIYATDGGGSGLDILELRGKARKIVFPHDDDDDD